VYPLAIVAAVFFNWWMTLIVFGVRLLLQGFIFYKTMNRLNEKDLWPMFPLFDILMCMYYVAFFRHCSKKQK
jgi:uncharacterized membrane protein HdeD (DUF308 family)